MLASEPRPLSGARTGTDQWGCEEGRAFLGAAVDVMWRLLAVIGWDQEGGVADPLLVLSFSSVVIGPAPGHESLTPDTWPLTFLRSRSTTDVSGFLATRCKVLKGRGGVVGGRRWERGGASQRGEGVWLRPVIAFFTFPNIVNQSQLSYRMQDPITDYNPDIPLWGLLLMDLCPSLRSGVPYLGLESIFEVYSSSLSKIEDIFYFNPFLFFYFDRSNPNRLVQSAAPSQVSPLSWLSSISLIP